MRLAVERVRGDSRSDTGVGEGLEMAKALPFSAGGLKRGVERVEKSRLRLTAFIEPGAQVGATVEDPAVALLSRRPQPHDHPVLALSREFLQNDFTGIGNQRSLSHDRNGKLPEVGSLLSPITLPAK